MRIHFLSGFRCSARLMLLLICTGFLWSPTTFAQTEEAPEDPLAKYSASGLLNEAMRLLGMESYAEVSPFLEEYIERMQDNEDSRVRNMVQEVRLKFAKIHIYLEDNQTASEKLQQYLDNKPIYKWREANKLLALSRYKLSEFDACISAVTNGLSEPPEADVEKKKVEYSTQDKEDLGGMTARQLKRLDEFEKGAREDNPLTQQITADVVEEPAYAQEELTQLHLLLAESYVGLFNWEECLEPYRYVVEHETNEDRKGYAIMQLVSALIEQREFDEATGFIMELYRTDARYNIRVNLALMSAATALFMEGELDSALPLYRMILPREELFVYQEKKIQQIRSDAGMGPVEITIKTNAAGRVQTLFGKTSAFSAVYKDGAAPSMTVMPMELIEEEDRLATLMGLPPYEMEVMLRLGQLYVECHRPWEALVSLNEVYSKDPENDQGERAFYEIIRVLIDPLEDYEQAEKRGLAYLDRKKEGLPPRQITYLLTGMYQKLGKWLEIKKLRPTILALSPESGPDEKKYDVELWYMQAVADLMLLDYQAAENGFRDVREFYPGSHQQDNASYWFAMSQLFLQKYDQALVSFESYPDQFPQGQWVADAAFRGGICLFATDKLPEAKVRFTKVINRWPDSAVYSDACSLRGDLLAADGLLNEAQLDYEEAIASARNPKQDTYAVFQMAAMFELERRYEEILAAVNAYLDRQGGEADVAKAAYWIGKTKLDQGLVAEAMAAYCDAVVAYGGDVRQDGVDLIINEMVSVSRRLEEDQLVDLKEILNAARVVSENETVTLRLRVLLARLDGAEAELGRSLLVEMTDLKQAPPPVMALICEASFEQKDYSRSEEILTIFLNRFEDSGEMRSAYKLRAFDLYASGSQAEALKLANEAQALYGTDSDLAWAQLMRGRLELALGRADAARKTLREVFGVRAWRGAAYAEAAYALGELNEALGDLKRAFSWYQRTYTLYKGYAKGHWAAESYLASARVLKALGLEEGAHNTYRAMLYDHYVNSLPQAGTASQALAPEEIAEIAAWLTDGVQTNLTVTLEMETADKTEISE